MDHNIVQNRWHLRARWMSRSHLLDALQQAGVGLNEYAHALLARTEFDHPEADLDVHLVSLPVRQLGLDDGGVLEEIREAAARLNLAPCPLPICPYLRLEWLNQTASSDHELQRQQAPDAAVTVVTVPLNDDPSYPKGFYLRVVDGVPWLRGYCCDEEYRFPPEHQLLFIAP